MMTGRNHGIWLLFLCLAVFFSGGNSFAGEQGLPSIYSVATLGVGTSGYISVSAATPSLEKILNAKVRLIPSDVRVSQLKMIKNGDANWNHSNLGVMVRPLFALDEYATKEWGPQKLGMVYMGANLVLGALVRDTSDIKSVKDLKGKKISVYPGAKLYWSSILSYANLSIDDVTVVPAGGYISGIKLLQQNRVDACYAASSSTILQEIRHTPGGIRFLDMPFSDKEAWRRVTKAYPGHIPALNPENYGVKEAWGKELVGFPNAEYVYLSLDDNIAYALTKAWYEGYENYKSVAADLKYYSPETALNCLNQPLPYHPGSVKFFKEKNVWTPEHEKWQKQQMDNQEIRLKAWESAVKDAESKGIKIARNNEKWLDLWQSYIDKL